MSNQEKKEKKLYYLHRDWTALYTLVTSALEKKAPVATRELHDACDLRRRGESTSAVFDGPLAWRVAVGLLTKGGALRTKDDKDYYETAVQLQKAKLPDGCTASQNSLASKLMGLSRYTPTTKEHVIFAIGSRRLSIHVTSIEKSSRCGN